MVRSQFGSSPVGQIDKFLWGMCFVISMMRRMQHLCMCNALLRLFFAAMLPMPLQSQGMLPANAWKSAPSASSWDKPKVYLPVLKKPGLLVIDAQENFRNYYGSNAISEMQLVVEAFRERCLPIVFKLWPAPPINEEVRRTSTCVPIPSLSEVAPSTESEGNRTVKYVEFDQFWENPHLDQLLKSWDVDHVIIVGGFTEHCVIATANALWNRKIPAIIISSAVGPRNATNSDRNPTKVPSVQHEAALIAMQCCVAQVVDNSSVLLEHLESHFIRGSVCPDTRVPAPPAGYMKHSFPTEQSGFCNKTLYPDVNTSGIDKDVGAWPLWAPLEAKRAFLSHSKEYQVMHI